MYYEIEVFCTNFSNWMILFDEMIIIFVLNFLQKMQIYTAARESCIKHKMCMHISSAWIDIIITEWMQ